MDKRAIPELSDAFTGALEWWRDAGVDCDFLDEPIRWIAEQAPASPDQSGANSTPSGQQDAALSPASIVSQGVDAASLPNDLDAFVQWWLTEPSLAPGPPVARVAPRGAAAAELMVVVPEPEPEDRERLLGGPQGRLLDGMLTAMGLVQDKVYVASALPRPMPGADWADLAAAGLGEVLAHHVVLARPKRLAVFGANILPLLGHDPPQGPADLRIFNHQCASTPLLAARSLAALLEQPRWKARVWQAWLDWTE